MMPQTKINQVQPGVAPPITPPVKEHNIRRNYIVLILLFLGVVVLPIMTIVYSQRFQYKGISPGPKRIGFTTNVSISFNKPITNGEEIMNNIRISPAVKTNNFIDKKNIVISPIGKFDPVTYTVTIPSIKSGDNEVKNLVVRFTPNKYVPSDNPGTAVDLDDIATKSYPKLSELDKQSDDYKIQYAFDGEKVVFDVLLIEPLDVEDESKVIENLKQQDTKMRTYIATLGIPKDKYKIRYQNDVQEELIYGKGGAPAN